MPRLEDAWIPFVCDDDAWVCFPILQQDIVSGVILFDEGVLQQQGIFFRVDHRVTDVSDLAHKHFGLVPVHLLMIVPPFSRRSS